MSDEPDVRHRGCVFGTTVDHAHDLRRLARRIRSGDSVGLWAGVAQDAAARIEQLEVLLRRKDDRIAELEAKLDATKRDLRFTLAWFDKQTRAEFRSDPDGRRIFDGEADDE